MALDYLTPIGPNLSMLVPAFNKAEGLSAFLEQLITLLNGCCSKFEVWIVDDGSRDTDGWPARLKAYLFNNLMKALTGLDLAGTSDFCLHDRQVVDTLITFPEKIRFLRSMTVWTSFATANIIFDVALRIGGNSQ